MRFAIREGGRTVGAGIVLSIIKWFKSKNKYMNKFFLQNIENKDEKILQTENIFKEEITETNKLIKYLLNGIILLGSLGFLIVGVSSYVKSNIIGFLDSSQIIFFPQGLTMCFYGSLGMLLSINQFMISLLKIGEGFNKFDKKNGTMTIFRKGFPWKNSDVNITYPLKDIVWNRSCIKKKIFLKKLKEKTYLQCKS